MGQISERFPELGKDGAPVRLGLMGGTFDPVHMGHLRVAEEVRRALELDVVLFMPAGNPVFKRDQHVTDAHVRLEMCRRAVADNPYFDVCPIEVEREGSTFTADTLRDLRDALPSNVKLFFIVGSDAAIAIGKWRNVAQIAELASLAVAAGRPGSVPESKLREAILAAAPFDLHIVNVSQLEVSSSALREALAAGDQCRYLITEPVRAFIRERGLYRSPNGNGATIAAESQMEGEGEGRVADCEDAAHVASFQAPSALSKEFFKARKKELEGRVSPKRFKHSLGVSDACAELARIYGLDVKKARLAGLLHDWDKGLDDEEARQRVRDLGMQDELDPWVVEKMPNVLHGNTAARALGREFPQIPADILQAIDRHTTAAEDMSDLDMALYIADAIEPGRQFGRIDELRAAVGEVSLEELYFQTYEYWTFLLLERKKPLHPDTMRIWNSIALRRQAAKKSTKRGQNRT